MKQFKQSLLVAALVLAASGAQAQSYPTKPIVLVNPYAAGGPADLVARSLAKELGTELGQQVVAENKAGGGATIGAAYVAPAEADGHTLLVGTAVPRHWCLALGVCDDGGWNAYEPTSGQVRALNPELIGRRALAPVLGFDHLHAVLLPRG